MLWAWLVALLAKRTSALIRGSTAIRLRERRVLKLALCWAVPE